MLRLLGLLTPVWVVVLVLILLFSADDHASARFLGRSGAAPPKPFSTVTFGTFAKYGNGPCPNTPKCFSGDTFFNTWADDNNIYTTSGDSSQWNATGCSNPCQTANLLFSTLDGYSPSLTGATTNTGVLWNSNSLPTDSANFKGSGTISVNGTLIVSAVRQCPGSCPMASIYASGQIITSTDHGVTWAPIPPGGANAAQPYASPTFTDPKFRLPSFIQYGKDYQGQTADGSDVYVYALSSDQSTAHISARPALSDAINLGRVPISLISHGVASDWEFYQGLDGMGQPIWGALSTTVPVVSQLNGTFQYGQTPQYLPAFGTYIMITFTAGCCPNTGDSTWDIWQAPHPWGPWTVTQQSPHWYSGNLQAGADGFYYPGIVPKSVAVDGGRTFTLLTTGDYQQLSTMYTMYIVPVTVN
jgi:hypothetical protein